MFILESYGSMMIALQMQQPCFPLYPALQCEMLVPSYNTPSSAKPSQRRVQLLLWSKYLAKTKVEGNHNAKAKFTVPFPVKRRAPELLEPKKKSPSFISLILRARTLPTALFVVPFDSPESLSSLFPLDRMRVRASHWLLKCVLDLVPSESDLLQGDTPPSQVWAPSLYFGTWELELELLLCPCCSCCLAHLAGGSAR